MIGALLGILVVTLLPNYKGMPQLGLLGPGNYLATYGFLHGLSWMLIDKMIVHRQESPLGAHWSWCIKGVGISILSDLGMLFAGVFVMGC